MKKNQFLEERETALIKLKLVSGIIRLFSFFGVVSDFAFSELPRISL